MKSKQKCSFFKFSLGLCITSNQQGQAEAKHITTIDWSLLPSDLWHLIGENLSSFPDRIRFRSVCKTWRSLLPPPQTPWLMLAPDDRRSRNTRGLFCLDGTQVVHQFKLPEAHKTRCIGSTGSWLVTVDANQKICSLNPFSRRRVELPAQTEFGFETRYATPGVTPRQLRDGLLMKVVLSSSPLSSGCIAMAIHNSFFRLAIARPGDPFWTSVKTPTDHFHDVIFYQSQFYGIDNRGLLVVCDVGNGSDPPKAIQLNGVFRPCTPYELNYLVEWTGELVYVVKFMDDDGKTYKLRGFEVYVFDFTNRTWNRLKSLGDYSLFLGINTSVSVLASRCPGIRRNCIYFTDDYAYGYRGLRIPGGRDMGVFDMEDGSVELHYKGISTSCYSPPLWIIPSDQS